MLNITLETHPNVLSAADVLGDSLYSEALHAESNKDLCRRFIQKIFNEGELSLLGNFMSPHVVNHELADSFGESDDLAQGHDIEWMADLVYLYRHAFPDLRFDIEDQIAEGDRVVTCLRMRGTQHNALMTIAPSGRKVDIAGIRVDRIVDGRIVESWAHLDALGMLRQLEALPPLNRWPRKLAPVSYETAPGAKQSVAWSSIPELPQPAFVS